MGVCVQDVCTRVARVGGRCAVVWLASEWHRVVCAQVEPSFTKEKPEPLLPTPPRNDTSSSDREIL